MCVNPSVLTPHNFFGNLKTKLYSRTPIKLKKANERMREEEDDNVRREGREKKYDEKVEERYGKRTWLV